MLFPAANADDHTREPRATTSPGSRNEHVNSVQRLGRHQKRIELGLNLAALIIATIIIVTAAHDDARKLTSDITTGQVMFTPA
jgi:hypothetical protein